MIFHRYRVGLAPMDDGSTRVCVELDPRDGDTIEIYLEFGDAARLTLDLAELLVRRRVESWARNN